MRGKGIAENSRLDRFLFCFQDVFAHRLRNINSLYIKIEQESANTIFCFSNIFPSFLPKFILFSLFNTSFHEGKYFFFLEIILLYSLK